MANAKKVDYPLLIKVLSIFSILAIMGIVVFRWNDIKGSCFLSKDSFATTTATILTSNIIEEHSKNSTSYHYDISYQFAVAGKPYKSNQITFRYTGTVEIDYAKSYVEKYPVGAQVTAYYQKSDPAFSVLEPDATESWWWILPVWLLASVAGLAYTFMRSRTATPVSVQ